MTVIERGAVSLAVKLASRHRDWRWREAKRLIKASFPCLCHHGWGLACDAYADRLIEIYRS